MRIQVFIVEGHPVLARGRGTAYVLSGSRAAPIMSLAGSGQRPIGGGGQGLSPPEAPVN